MAWQKTTALVCTVPHTPHAQVHPWLTYFLCFQKHKLIHPWTFPFFRPPIFYRPTLPQKLRGPYLPSPLKEKTIWQLATARHKTRHDMHTNKAHKNKARTLYKKNGNRYKRLFFSPSHLSAPRALSYLRPPSDGCGTSCVDAGCCQGIFILR